MKTLLNCEQRTIFTGNIVKIEQISLGIIVKKAARFPQQTVQISNVLQETDHWKATLVSLSRVKHHTLVSLTKATPMFAVGDDRRCCLGLASPISVDS